MQPTFLLKPTFWKAFLKQKKFLVSEESRKKPGDHKSPKRFLCFAAKILVGGGASSDGTWLGATRRSRFMEDLDSHNIQLNVLQASIYKSVNIGLFSKSCVAASGV